MPTNNTNHSTNGSSSQPSSAIRYHDEDLALPKDPHEIDAAAMVRVVEALNALRMNDPDRLGDWFGRFITHYRSGGDVLADDQPRSRIEVEWDLEHGAVLQRHPYARVAWRRNQRGATLFCSGLEFALPVKDAQRLAPAETLDATLYASLTTAGREAAMTLHAQGYYQLVTDEQD